MTLWVDRRTSEGGPCTHALVVGVSRYEFLPNEDADPHPDDPDTFGLRQARTPATSALNFARWLDASYGNPEAPIGTIRLLLSPSAWERQNVPGLAELAAPAMPATRDNVANAITEWHNDCSESPENVAVLYAGGYVIQLSKDEAGIVLLEDFAKRRSSVLDHSLDVGSVRRGMAGRTMADRQFYFVDACRVRPEAAARLGSVGIGIGLANPFESGPRSSIVYSGASSNTEPLGEPGKGTLFSQALLGCLDGLAAEEREDQDDRWVVTSGSLMQALPKVAHELADSFGVELTVTTGGQLEDVIFHVLPEPPTADMKHVAREAAEASVAATAETERIEVGTLDGAGNDAVGDSDQLGFQHYVDAFADLITSPHANPPLTIGIFGSWGMGKSFLLRHVEREISRRQDEESAGTRKRVGPRVHIVGFNAWEYSATEIVWPGLVRKIVEKLDEDVPWPWHKRWWTRLTWNLPRELRRAWVPLLAAALVAAVAIGGALWRDRTNLAAAIVAAVGALGVGGLIRAASNPVARWVTALFAESDYGRQIGYMEDIKHDLETLEARLHEGGNADAPPVGRILVLIDDLDRCEPEKAVEVLQAVNLLLNFSSFIVGLGIDARIVTGAIEKHYEGLLGKAGASGYEYLEKIVQIPFRIPEPSEDEVKAFIGKQLAVDLSADGEEKSDGEGYEAATIIEPARPIGSAEEALDGPPTADVTTEAEERYVPHDAQPAPAEAPAEEPEAGVPFTRAELNAFEQLVPFLRPNPRHLKRLVNVYRLVRALARSKNEEVILSNPAATIRWLVMWGQWPYTAHVMLERFERLLDEWEGEIVEDAPEGDPLQNLLDAVEPRLDAQIRDRLDDPADTLRDLLAVEGCGLAWDELRQIRKYTVNFNPAVEEQLGVSATDMGERDSETH
jgi:hypothetical protein